MSGETRNRLPFALLAGVAWAGAGLCAPARAETSPDLASKLKGLEARLEQQERRLIEQQAEIASQTHRLAEQQTIIAAQGEQLHAMSLKQEVLSDLRGAGYNAYDGMVGVPATSQPSGSVAAAQAAPLRAPVGEPPPAEEPRAEVSAIPQEASVLTAPGHLVIEPTADYTLTASNILVFRGVEIVPGVQLGVIEASNTSRAAESFTATARYGLTDRIEIEARVPYLWRQDRISVAQQRNQQVTRELDLRDSGLGDVELSARYQINQIRPNIPIFIAGVRAKSDTGSSPFTVERDEFGVEKHLATGSGYWTVEPSLAMLYPTDPAVIFGTLSYGFGITQKIEKVVDAINIHRVTPGNSISASLGFGFALNSKFSYSVGYRYTYFAPTSIKLNTDKERSKAAQVGSVVLGLSYRLTSRISLNGSFEFGTTADAPDNHILFRIPISF